MHIYMHNIYIYIYIYSAAKAADTNKAAEADKAAEAAGAWVGSGEVRGLKEESSSPRCQQLVCDLHLMQLRVCTCMYIHIYIYTYTYTYLFVYVYMVSSWCLTIFPSFVLCRWRSFKGS